VKTAADTQTFRPSRYTRGDARTDAPRNVSLAASDALL
jgi:hypothetical protein